MDEYVPVKDMAAHMITALAAAADDVLQHEVQGDEPHMHRLIVNGYNGPWVSKYAVAHNGIYCATSPYYAGELPRIFFALPVCHHPIDTQLRQPDADASPGSPHLRAVSDPAPGDEEGSETPPPPATDPPPGPAGDGGVPRSLWHRWSRQPDPARWVQCPECKGRREPGQGASECDECGGDGIVPR